MSGGLPTEAHRGPPNTDDGPENLRRDSPNRLSQKFEKPSRRGSPGRFRIATFCLLKRLFQVQKTHIERSENELDSDHDDENRCDRELGVGDIDVGQIVGELVN